MTGPAIKATKAAPCELEGDMTQTDIAASLCELQWTNGPDELRTFRMDQHVRDYLVARLAARRA